MRQTSFGAGGFELTSMVHRGQATATGGHFEIARDPGAVLLLSALTIHRLSLMSVRASGRTLTGLQGNSRCAGGTQR